MRPARGPCAANRHAAPAAAGPSLNFSYLASRVDSGLPKLVIGSARALQAGAIPPPVPSRRDGSRPHRQAHGTAILTSR